MSDSTVSRRGVVRLLTGQGAFGLGRRAAAVGSEPLALHERTASEIKAGVVPTDLSIPVGNVRRYGAIGDLKTNDTAAISRALSVVLPAGDIYVHFPPGSYLVDTLTFAHNGTYEFDSACLFANSASPQKALVKFTAAYCNVFNMSLNCRWKSNYESALWWASEAASAPSQSNNFWGMTIQNTLLAILFGATSGGINCPQSENYVYGFHTRGTSTVVHSNQPNGFIAFIGGLLSASKNEWDLNNPHAYDHETANVITNDQGVVRCVGCDLEKPESNDGCGFIQTGFNAVTELCDCDFEVACQLVRLSGGRFVIRGGGGYWNNGTQSCIALSGTTGGQLLVSEFTLNKDSRRAASDTAFLDLGAAQNWDITLSHLRLENQLNLIFYNGRTTPHAWTGNSISFVNVESLRTGGGAAAPRFPRVTSDVNNLLDLRGIDTVGTDAATWHSYGNVTGLSADVPPGGAFFASIECVIAGSGDVTSMNTADLGAIKATGILCKPGDQFLLSGWYRTVSAGDARIQAIFASIDGKVRTRVTLADNNNFAMGDWLQVTGLISVPPDCAYMGVGMGGSSITVRLIGLKLSRVA